MDQPSTTPAGAGPASAPLPGTQEPARVATSQQQGGLSRPGGGGADDAERLAKQGAEEIRREAREVKDAAKQGASDAAAKAREVAGQTAEQVRQQAGQWASQLREKGTALVDQQKSRAADLIGDCVAATRRAAQKLHDENDHNLAGYTDAIAERLESTSQYLREQDARRLVDDAADLARRRPEWVLGGAFVLGMALARFLKASRPDGAAYGSYRYDRPGEFDSGEGAGYGGGLSGQFGDAYRTEFDAGYVGGYSAGGARAYNPSDSGLGDAFDDIGRTPGATTPSGGGLATPGMTPVATDLWADTGAATSQAPAERRPAAPQPTGPDPQLDPTQRDNLGGPLT